MNIGKLPAGEKIIRLILQCVAANQPLLLIGGHGVGKTQLFKAAAEALGIGYICRDLSLMEPPDLVGIPFVGANGRTRFAPPAFLPSGGEGLLVIEELNRAPRYMIAPCLQLLTERVLNDYDLPQKWVPMAAINPDGEDYHVEPLDPALLARFVQVRIEADMAEWSYWAASDNNVHPKILEFVVNSPGVFDPCATNPRAWTYLSGQLRAWETGDRDDEMLLVAAAGLVGEPWAIAFQHFLNSGNAPLTPSAIAERYVTLRSVCQAWTNGGQLDLARATVRLLKTHLARDANFQILLADSKHFQNIRAFVEDLQPDLKRDLQEWFKAEGFEQLL